MSISISVKESIISCLLEKEKSKNYLYLVFNFWFVAMESKKKYACFIPKWLCINYDYFLNIGFMWNKEFLYMYKHNYSILKVVGFFQNLKLIGFLSVNFAIFSYINEKPGEKKSCSKNTLITNWCRKSLNETTWCCCVYQYIKRKFLNK